MCKQLHYDKNAQLFYKNILQLKIKNYLSDSNHYLHPEQRFYNYTNFQKINE